MDVLLSFLLVIGCYLLGSVNGSILLTRVLRIRDIRLQGSGNAGATNMARIHGLGYGLLTLFLDMFKGFVCTQAGRLLLGDVGVMLGGMACLVGHCFPVFYGFKGGKGISVGAMLALAVDWRVCVAVFVAFFVVAPLSRKVSLGSVCACVTFPVASFLVGVSIPKLALALFTMVLILFQHRGNIRRLLNGTEPDFRAASPKKKKGRPPSESAFAAAI